MALTKASATIRASASVSASTTVTDTSVDLRSVYGGVLTWKITNGTAPTTAPTIEVQISHDNSNFYTHTIVAGNITASSALSGPVTIPVAVMYLRTVCTGGATNGSTMEVYMEQVTAY